MLAWHFAALTLRNTGALGQPDQIETYVGTVVPGSAGVHACVLLRDTLRSAPGTTLRRVDMLGATVVDGDRVVGNERKILWEVEFGPALVAFARQCAQDVIGIWPSPPAAVTAFLSTGRGAAEAHAAAMAAIASDEATRSASRAAAVATGSSATQNAWVVTDAAGAPVRAARQAAEAAARSVIDVRLIADAAAEAAGAAVIAVGAAGRNEQLWIQEDRLTTAALAAHTPPAPITNPLMWDIMSFDGKPGDLGDATKITFIYEWEATIRDDPGPPPYAQTIEEEFAEVTVPSRQGSTWTHVVIDIESLVNVHPYSDDAIITQYVDIAKGVAPELKWAWWNTGLRVVLSPPLTRATRRTEVEKWRKRHSGLDLANDFFALATYYTYTDTLAQVIARETDRFIEARKWYPNKQIVAVSSPHRFGVGDPWPHISGAEMAGLLDWMATLNVDAIGLWSFEGTGNLQDWSEAWPWVAPLRARIGPDGRYQAAV